MQLEYIDGSPVDSNLFSYDDSPGDSSQDSIQISSDDTSKVGSYTVRAYAKYAGDIYPKSAMYSEFNVDINDPCQSATLTIDSSIISSLEF